MQQIFDFWQIIDVVLKLVLATLCGGLVGLIKGGERSSIGFSTTILACFTSALLILIILKMTITVTYFEIGIASILLGYAFIAGSLIKSKAGSLVSIFDAFTLWAVGGMGIAIGTGNFVLGIAAGIIMSILLNIIYNKFLTDNN